MPVTEEFVRDNQEVLERHTNGLKIGEFLGSGVWGTAFQSSDPNWVVKITKDIHEVRASQEVMMLRVKMEFLPGLVDILTVRYVEELEDDCESLYIIIRESVTPVEQSDLDKKFVEELDSSLYVIEERDAYSESEVASAMKFLRKHAPHLEQAMINLSRYGYALSDIDIINVGVISKSRFGAEKGSIVMFDVSFDRFGRDHEL